ncbi:MAG: alpha/beta hydrolase [Rhodospirillaceae bacterium]
MTQEIATAFPVDWLATPKDVIATVAARAERLETPIPGAKPGATMVWHRWPGPDDGPPLVLVHGGWGSWTHWIKTVPVMAARSSVLACDLPGLGQSGGIGRPETILPVAEALAIGIETLIGPERRYDIAGFSFGGIAAAHAAALYGRRCRSFTAVGAAGFGDLHYIVGGIQVPDPRLAKAEIDAVHRSNLKILMLATDAAIDPLAIHIHRDNISRGRFRSRRISVSNGLVEALPRIEGRIGGIWGALDITGNGLEAIEARRDIFHRHQPDSPFDIIDGGGHWVMYETPDAFNATLARHLAAHQAADPA